MGDLKHVTEPRVGWRIWLWRDGVLAGEWLPWESQTVHAICLHSDHPAPDPDCGCGFFVMRDLDEWRFDHVSRLRVIGKVEYWGKVVEGEDGFRVSDARIIDIWVGDEEELLGEIGVRYPGVEVRSGTPGNRSIPTDQICFTLQTECPYVGPVQARFWTTQWLI